MATDWSSRIELYKQIEVHRKRPLVVYVTSKREGASSHMSTDALPHIIEQLDLLPEESTGVDFLIASLGGDPMAAWRIMSLLQQRVGHVAVLVPQSAYSAATLVAFGANEIIMHPNGHIGPVDMQVRTYSEGKTKSFSTEDISAFLDFVRESLKITDQEHVRALFETTCKEVGSLGIGFTARSSKLAVDLADRLLGFHMKDEEGRVKRQSIVENMSRKFQSHAYPVSRTEAIEIGLPVGKERDKPLEKMMWDVWLNIEEDLKETTPFHPLLELFKSTESKKLLAPVPQVYIPSFATGSGHYQTGLADVIKAIKETIEPVDFETKNAIVESVRAARAHITHGKILACRNPDLVINYHMVATSRGWEKVERKSQ